ncbi:metallophosphoesterase [Paractinoplanes deccanensis]|uniref:Metallophosphoesterase n=1 Tax=Paractinoplanes deccanensis TaxID=113561 RepID=A0ABQ3YH88_9ACTN|nr:metallophosphoesterase [Actinoplanes deccanensis]GID79339.1 metallophosphoesterase [Actinoplanes deccanensis]
MIAVAHVSDLHLGAHDPAAAAGLVADVVAAGPDLTVVTGDSTMRARTREFRQARTLLGRLPRPLLVVTGNHDLPLLSWRRVLDPYGRYRSWICDELDPVRRIPGLTALGLQSMPRWRWKNGRLTHRQAGLAARALGEAPAGDVRVLALHHPPSAGWLPGWRRVVRAGRPDLVLAGHTHLPRVLAGDGCTLVVAGTATSHRTRGVPHSWSLITVSGGLFAVEERYLDGGGWYTGRTTKVPRLSAAAS